LAKARDIAAELHSAREEAAPRLAEAATQELIALAMPQAVLSVAVVAGVDDDPPVDRCEMTLQVNPGLPAGPLADVASGGELSRVLLALHSVAAGGGRETWVFDEVDAGVGGETAGAVAERLARLADGRQVVVITHLPQVAALAGAHYRLVKGVDDDGRTETRVEPVPGDELVDELCRMLGARPGDAGARRHAQELLARRPKRQGRTAA
jgi:DNA repair protein RecN (Recombination protein N)